MTRADLPAMDPSFVATAVEALPERLRKRLGSTSPSDWSVDGHSVDLGSATVTLSPPDGAVCDCLLSPRCLHVAHVLLACPVAESARTTPHAPAPADDPSESLNENQVAVLEHAESCLAAVLDRGLAGLTPVDTAALLRVVSAARVHHVPVLAAAFSTLHGQLGNRVTDAAITALAEAAIAVHRLRWGHDAGEVGVDKRGLARRTYSAVGNLKLRGWACEPVLTATGYGGVTSYFVDERDGRLWTLSSVKPGPAAQVAQAYGSTIELGDLHLPHRDAVRGGLLLTDATASPDGRLGRGSQVRASTRPPNESAVPADGWWFGEAVLAGVEDNGQHPVFAFETADGPLRCTATPVAEQLGMPALRVVAGAAGTLVELRLRARTEAEPGPTPWILIGVGHGGEWIFPGLDQPAVHWLGVPHAVPATISSATIDPAAVLRRWRDTVARQGRRGINAEQLLIDATWLRSHASPRRAALLEHLARTDDLPRHWTAIAAVC